MGTLLWFVVTLAWAATITDVGYRTGFGLLYFAVGAALLLLISWLQGRTGYEKDDPDPDLAGLLVALQALRFFVAPLAWLVVYVLSDRSAARKWVPPRYFATSLAFVLGTFVSVIRFFAS
jgi:hypothetical protein